ncbi:hypothetical protein HYH03_017307 [Edaphochlamys debaryana]|uniref:Uncharacterized protein n=1 Tax=Edaphochlamys debaryana TaxID=47281 RepID=A0A835XI73_9CHLO|nr:hypothetical protein HYH03_017307 [Edaphochlamys debaryana]|eukprot:KAG2483855.1 hypothetical protein HYH03_017307 [Edaphochlamys debaryana]
MSADSRPSGPSATKDELEGSRPEKEKRAAPRKRRGGWLPEELEELVALHAAWGNKWTQLAKRFKQKSDNDLKNIFHSALRSKTSETNLLLRAYAQAVGANCDEPALRQQAYEAAKRLQAEAEAQGDQDDMDQETEPEPAAVPAVAAGGTARKVRASSACPAAPVSAPAAPQPPPPELTAVWLGDGVGVGAGACNGGGVGGDHEADEAVAAMLDTMDVDPSILVSCQEEPWRVTHTGSALPTELAGTSGLHGSTGLQPWPGLVSLPGLNTEQLRPLPGLPQIPGWGSECGLAGLGLAGAPPAGGLPLLPLHGWQPPQGPLVSACGTALVSGLDSGLEPLPSWASTASALDVRSLAAPGMGRLHASLADSLPTNNNNSLSSLNNAHMASQQVQLLHNQGACQRDPLDDLLDAIGYPEPMQQQSQSQAGQAGCCGASGAWEPSQLDSLLGLEGAMSPCVPMGAAGAGAPSAAPCVFGGAASLAGGGRGLWQAPPFVPAGTHALGFRAGSQPAPTLGSGFELASLQLANWSQGTSIPEDAAPDILLSRADVLLSAAHSSYVPLPFPCAAVGSGSTCSLPPMTGAAFVHLSNAMGSLTTDATAAAPGTRRLGPSRLLNATAAGETGPRDSISLQRCVSGAGQPSAAGSGLLGLQAFLPAAAGAGGMAPLTPPLLPSQLLANAHASEQLQAQMQMQQQQQAQMLQQCTQREASMVEIYAGLMRE